jgi:hypothetical protein
LLLLIFAPPSPDGGTGRRARLKIWLSQGSAGSIPVLGTKARVRVSLSTHASLWPFLHTQSHTHTVFFGCEGGKYPHTQTQTHSVFCGFDYARFTLAFSSHSNPHSHCLFGCEGAKYPHTQTHSVFLSVKEQNILTLKLKLTLFFLNVHLSMNTLL